MGISVGDLLSMDFFKDFHVIAGHKGLNREIQGVSFLEVPEGHRWSIGKELIFTSGYIFAEFEGYLDKFCENFIPSHAALVIKRGSYLDKIPEKQHSPDHHALLPVLDDRGQPGKRGRIKPCDPESQDRHQPGPRLLQPELQGTGHPENLKNSGNRNGISRFSL